MATPDGRVPVPGSERAPVEGARPAGAVPGDEHVEVTVVVRYHKGSKPLGSTAKFGVPAPGERKYLTREQLAEASGADPADMHKVEEFAADHGLTVLDSDAARRTVSLAGTAAQMAEAFGVTLERYEHADGAYRGRTGAVHVPPELADIVEAVLGLDDRPAASPHLRVGVPVGDRAADPRAVAASFTPVQLADLYDFPDGADGTGQCIAIIELGGGYKTADLKAYFKSLGLKMPKVTAIGVDGGKNAPTGDPNSADGEVALDIEVAGAVAPGAQLAVYFAPNTDRGFLDAITTALHDTKRKPSVISISWGGAEANWTAQSLAQFDAAFASAAALGVTILCAAGDDGSNDSMTDGKAHADFPSSSPHVTACGGTRLDVTNGTIHDEIVWNNPGHGSTGGGISDTFPVPSWQKGKVPKSANPGHRAGRAIPDLAADADPATGYKVIVDGSSGVFGGTSAVAPLIAGLIARINQAEGQPAGLPQPDPLREGELDEGVRRHHERQQRRVPRHEGVGRVQRLGPPDRDEDRDRAQRQCAGEPGRRVRQRARPRRSAAWASGERSATRRGRGAAHRGGVAAPPLKCLGCASDSSEEAEEPRADQVAHDDDDPFPHKASPRDRAHTLAALFRCDQGRADDARVGSEPCGNDRQARRDLVARRTLHQLAVARVQSQAAAYHDRVRVERADQPGKPGAELPGSALDHRSHSGILEHLLGTRSTCRQREPTSARELLDVLSDLDRVAVGTAVGPPVDRETEADARANGHVEHDRERPGGAEARLGDRRRPHVGLDHHGVRAERIRDVELAPVERHGALRRAIEADQLAQPDADRRVGRRGEPLDEGSAVGKHPRTAAVRERRRLEAPHDRAVADVHHSGGELRAADVNPDRGAHRRITSNTVEASQPYKPSPRPTFDGPAHIPYRSVQALRVGRPRRGRGQRLDLRVERADPRARVRAPAARRVPPLAEPSDGLRGGRAAVRARGHDGHRESGDRRGAADRDRRECLLPPRYLAPRVRARRRAVARAGALRAAARHRAAPGPTPARGRTSRRAATPTTTCSARSPRPGRARGH